MEFVHMFSSFGAEVTLVVSRQHVLPGKDPEVAGVLEDDFVKRGVRLLKGARAVGIDRDEESGGVIVRCDDGRVVRSSHAVLAIGSVPNTDDLGLEAAGVELDDWGYVPINHHCATNQKHVYAAGDVSGKLPLASVACSKLAVGSGRFRSNNEPNCKKIDGRRPSSEMPEPSGGSSSILPR